VATALTDGTTCSAGVCSAGSCVAACVAGQGCTPATASPCQEFQTSCNATLTQTSCVAIGNQPDGASCGTGLRCSTGACVSATTRTVSSTLQTIYLRDDGTRAVRAGWDADFGFGSQVTALIYPDDSDPSGYTTVPVTVGADSSFSVPGVPFGPYFIQVDLIAAEINGPGSQIPVVERTLYQASTNTPDLSIVVSKRPDQAVDSGSNLDIPVHLSVSGFSPIATTDSIRFVSSDSILNMALRPTSGGTSSFTNPAHPGDTAMDSDFPWSARSFGVLPDASKGDSVWLWQRKVSTPSPGLTLTSAASFVKLTDLTVQDPQGATITKALAPVPQTGSFAGNASWSQFAALGADVHPGATPTADVANGPFIGFEVIPQGIAFPDQPIGQLPPDLPIFVNFSQGFTEQRSPQTFFAEATLAFPVQSAADASYGAITYGQFFDSTWHRAAQVSYSFDVPLHFTDGSALPVDAGGFYRAWVPAGALRDPVVPLLGPPTAPQINGNDAFAFLHGAGAQPTISWSVPSLGTATKYLLTVAPVNFTANQVATTTIVLYDRTSLKLPPGIVDGNPASIYYGSITAVSSPDRLDDPVLGLGTPTVSANTLFGVFLP
jgi:hypothetical protein